MATPYVGEVRAFAGTFAPYGWFLCDGSLQSIAQYQVLYTLIGTTYGGDGVNTFGLPDLRGRAFINQGNGAGLSTYVMGQQVGVESVTLTTTQMPNHNHTFSAINTAGTTQVPGPTVAPAQAPANHSIYSTGAAQIPLSPQAVTPTGGSQPHENRQPCLAITYIIAFEGVFPSQN